MARLRHARNMNPNKVLLIDSAVLACKPPAAAPPALRERTPLQRYIHFLLLDCLGKDKAAAQEKGAMQADGPTDVLAKMRRLPWDDEGCEDDVLQAMLEVRPRCFLRQRFNS